MSSDPAPSGRNGRPHLWRPYCQMRTAAPALAVASTLGSRIRLADGRELIDGIASWWTACHGYNHPRIADAVRRQLALMPHVMFGGLTHEPAERLAARLASLLPGDLDHVFFTDSGSVAVEVAMKMAIQFFLNDGVEGRDRILGFRGGYHGDTFATMAVSDLDDGMHRRFRNVLPGQPVADLPRDADALAGLETLMAREGHRIAAILVEPLVQGAGGMLFHERTVLRRLRDLADRHGALLIFDEVFTGFGRTGTLFACEGGADGGSAARGGTVSLDPVTPDIVTLSKALTGGTMALAATVATGRVFERFLSEDPDHALMHGPTFMANPLACAAADASLDLFAHEPRLAQAAAIGERMRTGLEPLAALPGVRDVRVRGAIGVVEYDRLEHHEALKARFVEAGVFVRPFGRIVYLTPALTIGDDDLAALIEAVCAVCARSASTVHRG